MTNTLPNSPPPNPPPLLTRASAAQGVQRLPMVRWYQPLLLIGIGIRALLATVIGNIADNREFQSMDSRPQNNEWDFRNRSAKAPSSDERPDAGQQASANEMWFDFVADLGDGWDATHAVASTLAQPELLVDGKVLPRGELLLLGGDLVYPGPSIEAYTARTLGPYQAACEKVPEFQADMFAVPGNHDWYDGLHAFQDIFCHDSASAPEWPFGHWHKQQTHSYFAWQLPHSWWVLAPDVQLDSRLNPAQRTYFRQVAQQMQNGDRVIVISPSPHWSYIDPNANGDVVRWLVALCGTAAASVEVVLTGDLHHYSRLSNSSSTATDHPVQLITAGGGGAFLHPTHQLASEVQLTGLTATDEPQNFRRETTYPSAKTSRRFSYGNLLFPITNWELSLFVGFIYTMLAWVLETRLLVGDQQVGQLFQAMLSNHGGIGETLTRMFAMLPKSPEFALAVLLTGLGLTAFNENCTRRTRLILGVLHTLLHLIGLIITYCVAVEITDWLHTQMSTLSFSFFWFLLTMVVFGGGVGGVVIGIYLLLSLNLFGANLTNAFSSLRIASHKNFLRLHINAQGQLTIYPLGIDQVHDKAVQVHSIERPIVL